MSIPCPPPECKDSNVRPARFYAIWPGSAVQVLTVSGGLPQLPLTGTIEA